MTETIRRCVCVTGLCGAVLCGPAAAAERAEDLWCVAGDFPRVAGEVTESPGERSYRNGEVAVTTTLSTDDLGVTLRRTVVRNVSSRTIAAHRLTDLMRFDGGEYEVYTQANTWQNESLGVWQTLNTEIGCQSRSMRTCSGAAPMLALWNVQEGRGTVFHLLADSAWELRARRVYAGDEKTEIVVEAGVNGRNLSRAIAPGESVVLPEILSYDFANRTDLDAFRLHRWWNRHHPARSLPSVYNTWMYRFDRFDAEGLLAQIAKAKEIGFEYFVIDAGWFGSKKGWTTSRGDWEERPDGILNGRLAEISEAVRAAGMKFGFWMESETADAGTRILKEHPDWFLPLTGGGAALYDFGNAEARAAMVERTVSLVRRYGAEFLKQDFNADAEWDVRGAAYEDYHRGFAAYLDAVRRACPGIYLECCASGGMRTDLGRARLFDGFWPSDNQSPYHGLRIVHETMLRLPPRLMERWFVARSVEGLQPNYYGRDARLLACEDATWTHVRSADRTLFETFFAGGPVCASCDLTALSPADADWLRGVLATNRLERAFWCAAEGRVLCETSDLTILQFSDARLAEVRVRILSNRTRQTHVRVRPVVDPEFHYAVNGVVRSGGELAEKGLRVPVPKNGAAAELVLRKVPGPIVCDGVYGGHLQGVDTDGTNIWWSFTKELVRTDLKGAVLARVSAPSHEGDLCVRGDRLYVAVNRGRFNQTAAGVSEVRVYDKTTLKLEGIHPLDMPHGAGGMTEKDGRFYVVGGLPATHEVNYVYEYDGAFRLVRRHELKTGFTWMGIQSATVMDGGFRFGIYGATGDPEGVLACPADLSGFTRYLGAGSMGILRLNGVVYTARALKSIPKGDPQAGPKGILHRAELVPDADFCSPARKYVPLRRGFGCVRIFYEADGTDGWFDCGYELKPDGYKPLFCQKNLFLSTTAAATNATAAVPAVGIGGGRSYSAPDLVRAVRRCAERDESMALHVPGSARDAAGRDETCRAAVEAVRAECARLGVRLADGADAPGERLK